MLEVRNITDISAWSNFLQSQEFVLFTQAEEYRRFAEKLGEKHWLIGVYENNTLVGGSLVFGVRARRGDYMTLLYGPVLDYANEHHFAAFVAYIKTLAKNESYSFVRVSPFVVKSPEIESLFRKYGFLRSPMHVLAENTWMLELNSSLDSILAGMNKNHRNLIRRCEREGVKVTITKDPEAVKRLNDMHDQVAKRHGFQRFSRNYITEEFKLFSKSNNAVVFEAHLPDGRIDASAIIIFYGNMACYRHSASLRLDRKLPTSYLIQWHAIQEAKKRGLRWYNFWGIAPKDASKKHPFAGVTHFKRGFGGVQRDLLPCHDTPISKKYYFTRIFELYRRARRGFNA